jgi:hypothetical protein
VPPEENDDFNVDLTFTGRQLNIRRIATVVAVAGFLLIIATMVTNLAATLLPMNDDYLQVMVPVATDGGEPLGLTSLKHLMEDKTISVTGTVSNRTDKMLSELVAVVQLQDTTGRFPENQEIAIMPPELAPQATGEFMAMATLQEKPSGYIIKFRFAEGPFIPHKDERGGTPTFTITPQVPK